MNGVKDMLKLTNNYSIHNFYIENHFIANSDQKPLYLRNF
jgi:hypothetical protein